MKETYEEIMNFAKETTRRAKALHEKADRFESSMHKVAKPIFSNRFKLARKINVVIIGV